MLNMNFKQLGSKENDDIVAKSEELCMSPLLAIASPKALNNFQPNQKPQSTFKPDLA